jgi:predicted lipoprotein with Yx(FWY)xxD motif
MSRLTILVALAIVAAGAGVWFYRSRAPSTEFASAPLATPTGVTLHKVRLGPLVATGIANGKQMVPRLAYADAKGHTAYTFDKDTDPVRSACADDCAKIWAPVEATQDAKPFANWTIIARDDGVRQWAVKGKALYRYSGDSSVGEAKGEKADSAFHVAIFDPAASLPTPDGLAVREIPRANGVGLVDERGMTLYAFDGELAKNPQSACADTDCASRWCPVPAAFVAQAVGEFTVVQARDGSDQWAYRGMPLFTFDGDVEAGDVAGSEPEKGWRPVLIVSYFMPDGIIIRHNHFGGENLATSAGMTLYAHDGSAYMQGHSLREGVPLTEAAGRQLGGSRCDAECVKTWPALKAPGNAQPSGFWDVVASPDGTKQWAYLGYPLHLYSGDKRAGDMNGNDIYDFLPGEDLLKNVSIPAQVPHGSAALVWRAVTP